MANILLMSSDESRQANENKIINITNLSVIVVRYSVPIYSQ